MKKVFSVMAIAGLLCATSAFAASLEVRVVGDGDAASINVGGPGPVNVFVQARLDGGGAPTSAGLALIGWNMTGTGNGGAANPDLCDTSGFLLTSTLVMDQFDRLANPGPGFSNFGLTNPSASPNLSGYSGTCSGTMLLQLGGGQNTIGNTPGGAPYPIGSVDQGIGNGGWVTIAEGIFDVPALGAGENIVLAADTVFANTINTGQASAPYAVTEVTNITVTGDLTISAGVLCDAGDVNCDGFVDANDVAGVANGANFQQNPAACDRTDVNGDTFTDANDIAFIVNNVRFQVINTPGCTCQTSTCGTPGCPACP